MEKNYEVYGIVRRNSITEHQRNRLSHLDDKIELSYGDLTDKASIDRALSIIKPDEIYNLGAQSHVRVSFEIPQFTFETNAIGVYNILESMRHFSPKSKFYQASSSEMFGRSVDDDGFQRETTKFEPTSPYGCAKVFGFNLTKHYRKAYNLFAVNGILFNHESKRRGSNFVTTKVIKTAIRIKKIRKKTCIRKYNSSRDWGHSSDYVRAMHTIISQNTPDDYVVATGQTRSVRQLCEYVFEKLDLELNDALEISEKFMRPEELPYLKGDSSKIRDKLNWRPELSFEDLIDEMINFWLENYKNETISY